MVLAGRGLRSFTGGGDERREREGRGGGGGGKKGGKKSLEMSEALAREAFLSFQDFLFLFLSLSSSSADRVKGDEIGGPLHNLKGALIAPAALCLPPAAACRRPAIRPAEGNALSLLLLRSSALFFPRNRTHPASFFPPKKGKREKTK
jgi:hypothetical protein